MQSIFELKIRLEIIKSMIVNDESNTNGISVTIFFEGVKYIGTMQIEDKDNIERILQNVGRIYASCIQTELLSKGIITLSTNEIEGARTRNDTSKFKYDHGTLRVQDGSPYTDKDIKAGLDRIRRMGSGPKTEGASDREPGDD